MPMVSVNRAELYHEVRGSGPPVLLIMGATGDGGHFDTLADLLADEFTVITYDRRGNGRSPAPAGWTTTSAVEQADDAAALVDSLAVGPLAVFGTSSGGNFALWMLTRHPAMVRGAVLHEPGVYAVLDDFDVVRAPLQGVVRQSMAEGGPHFGAVLAIHLRRRRVDTAFPRTPGTDLCQRQHSLRRRARHL
jgi:pimeloyl-ACP methyl ester carboxylesterase